jgi:hypothetical protein
MTEGEWLTCREPEPMLDFVKRRASRRKLRLVAVACLRFVWLSLGHEAERYAAEVAERHADGNATDEELIQAYAAVYRLDHPDAEDAEDEGDAYLNDVFSDACTTAGYARNLASGDGSRHADLLRDLFGNPFRPVVADSRWFAGTVVALATALYQERAFDRLPLLADALEEAGCSNPEVLDHCRRSGEHARGCWVLDLLLRKE